MIKDDADAAAAHVREPLTEQERPRSHPAHRANPTALLRRLRKRAQVAHEECQQHPKDYKGYEDGGNIEDEARSGSFVERQGTLAERQHTHDASRAYA